MLYYFLLLVAYAVVTVLTAKPIWTFVGIMQNERSYDPAVIGDFSYIKVALITFVIVSILIGIISRIHYSYYFNNEYSDQLLPELKGKLIRRYLAVMIGAFVIGFIWEPITEQGYLADIRAGFGLGKTVALLASMLLVGLPLCLGRLLFVRKEKAAVFETYDNKDLLSGHGKNYRKLTDEALFPALMKKPASERLKGKLAEDYKKEVLALGDKYLGSYRKREHILKPEEYVDYKDTCRSAGRDRCWGPINEWLNKMLETPEKVDSFPDVSIDLGTAEILCTFSTPDAVGMARMEAQKRAVEDAMNQWNEERDSKERMFNAVLAGDLRTDEERYLGGGIGESTYMEGMFQRDVAEAEARRKIESRIYTDDDDLLDVTRFEDEVTLSMNYFRSLGWYIDLVKDDWEKRRTRREGLGIPKFYQMLWPVYVAGHPKNANDSTQFKGARRNFFCAVGCLILFFVLKMITDVTKSWEGLMAMLNVGLVLLGFGAALGALIFLFMAAWYLKDGISDLKESSIKNVRKQAASCAPALYRQLRFYKLWMKGDPAVCALEEILNRYYETEK